MLSQYPRSAFQGSAGVTRGGSAAVWDPNPPRPFARCREICIKSSRLSALKEENYTLPCRSSMSLKSPWPSTRLEILKTGETHCKIMKIGRYKIYLKPTWQRPCHPKPSLTKPPFLICSTFPFFFLALIVRMFRICFHFAVFPAVCSMPKVDPHVPHILWVVYEENWDDWLCQGWVWVQPTMFSLSIFLYSANGPGFGCLIGVAQTAFLVNGVLYPAKKGPFWQKRQNDKFAFYPMKTRVSLLRPPKAT